MIDAQGREMVKQKKLANDGKVVKLLRETNQPIEVAMEASGSWYRLYDLPEEEGMG